MAKYRKKPIIIEAIRWSGRNTMEVAQFLEKKNTVGLKVDKPITIVTLEGNMEASVGDYIIRGVKGEIYPCKPDIFAATYEPVPDGTITESALQDQIDAVTNEEIRAKRSHLPTREDKRGARRLG